MPRIPKNPYKLTKIRWLDACNHADANNPNEGIFRDTVGYLVRDTGSVVRMTNTVDYDPGSKEWAPSDQDDIVDIPKGMVVGRRNYG
ncbi:MAG: hypothetical protein ACXABY_09490 [Candidatus Thorarchaeota archaeon]|jgi:hypothetical protein